MSLQDPACLCRKNAGWEGQAPRSLLAPLLSIPKGHAHYVAAALSPPSEHGDLTHLPRGRTLIRFCTSSSLSESLVSATAWLWEARPGKVRAARGPPLHHSPSISVPLTSGSSGSSGWAEPSAGVCTLGRGCPVPCGGRAGAGCLRACRPGPSRKQRGRSTRIYLHEGSSDLPGINHCKGTDPRPSVD